MCACARASASGRRAAVRRLTPGGVQTLPFWSPSRAGPCSCPAKISVSLPDLRRRELCHDAGPGAVDSVPMGPFFPPRIVSFGRPPGPKAGLREPELGRDAAVVALVATLEVWAHPPSAALCGGQGAPAEPFVILFCASGKNRRCQGGLGGYEVAVEADV